MEKIRRNERMSAMMKILSASPNHIFTLSYFCELFGAAKSTMSEDIDILRDVVKTFQLGELETVTGAAGGVRYRPRTSRAASRAYIASLCEKLSRENRVLPGGFLYYSDILSNPQIVQRMGGGILRNGAGFRADHGNQRDSRSPYDGECLGRSAGDCPAFQQSV